VSRDWVNSFEAGKPRVELFLVLALLEALGMQLDLTESANSQRARPAGLADLDALLDEYREP